MKKFFIGTALIFVFAQAGGASEPQVKAVRIRGMVCSFCAQGLIRGAQGNPKVADVNVSLVKKTMNLVMKENQTMTDEEISQLVQDAGFKVENN